MIIRARYPKPKDVMLINDTPFKVEVAAEEKFSSIANMNLLTSLRTGRVSSYGKLKPDPDYKGINSINIFTTYLDYNYFAEGNYDFRNDFKKRKDLIVTKGIDSETYTDKLYETDEYFKLSNQKDVYVSARLWEEFQQLLVEITEVKPKLIILTGKWSLFFLTGCSTLITNMGNAKDRKPLGALNKFRSSIMAPSDEWNLKYLIEADELFSPIVIPIFHTLTAMSMPDKLSTIALDIEKLGWVYHQIINKGLKYYKIPDKEYLLGIEKNTIITYLDGLLERITIKPSLVSIDIETFYYSLIDCIGITDSVDSGLCIPFAHKGNANYWSLEDEIDILCKLREVMLHPGCLHVGQNYSFDCQYFHKLWHIDVTATYDSMILHHVLYNYLPKNLGFLASLYSEHYSYWKEDITATEDDPSTRWIYNIKDIQHTLEVTEVLLEILDKQPIKMKEFYRFQQNEIAPALVDMMNTGLKVDLEKKQKLYIELNNLLTHIEATINNLFNIEINLKSPNQIKALFKDFLKVVPIVNKKTKAESFGSDSMLVYLEEYPLYSPLITLILEYRSIGVFVRTFLAAKVDSDNRMRCSYNVAGTKTYRLASRKNAFGSGCNLQNVPSKGKIDLHFALESYNSSDDEAEVEEIQEVAIPIYGSIDLPNIKELFICDEGETFFDIDLAAADARIIAWISDCKFLTELFEDPEGDPYLLLAKEYYKNPNLTKKDKARQIFKAVAHGCLTGEHEVLTKEGWVRIDKVSNNKEIAVWDRDSNIKFEVPKQYNEFFIPPEENLIAIKGTAFHQLSTLNHRFPCVVDTKSGLKVKQAIDLNKTARIPYNGNYSGGTKVAELAYMQLIAAVQADGHIAHIALDGTPTFSFRFVKDRKIVRLKGILQELNIPYKVSSYIEDGTANNKPRVTIRFNGYLQTYMKKLDWWILDYSKECFIAWVNELQYWDGSTRSSNGVRTAISTTDRNAAEIMQTAFQLCGYGSKLITKLRDETRQTIYEVSMNNRKYHNMSTGTKTIIEHKGTKVYCPTTSTGFFMVRYNGNIMVTGNSNYLGRANTLAAKAGLSVRDVEQVQKFYFSLCPEIPLLHKEVERQVNSRGYLENVWGARGWFLNKNEPMLLNQAMAWAGSSPVGILINKGLANIHKNDKRIIIRGQTHDSLWGTYRTDDLTAKERIIERCSIPLPFDIPRIIPVDIKTSILSYGNCS